MSPRLSRFHNADRHRSTNGLPPSAPLPATIQTLAFWRDPHAYLKWCRHHYGSRFTVNSVGMPPLVFMSEPDDIKAIVRAPANILHPGAGGITIKPLVGEGSFMLADEDAHLSGRRAALPMFHHRLVQEHATMVQDIVTREVATWPRDTPVAIHPYLRALALRVILQKVFGDHEFLEALHRRLFSMFSITGSLSLQEPQLRTIPPWRGIWKRFLADRAEVDRIIGRLIRDGAHTEARDSGLVAMLRGSSTSQGADPDAKRLRDDLMSVILAGHETTASELAWAFQLLAHHPEVMRRLVDDLDGGGTDYLTATVQEVLRHRPVFLFAIPRVVRSPFQIADTLYRPPVHLIGCVHLMHHDPELYAYPERFWPERFLAAEPPAEIWMPWGGGRKRCPGHHLATLEMHTVLRTVLSELTVSPVARRIETARWRSVIVTPAHGSSILLKSRARTVTSGSGPDRLRPSLHIWA